MPVDITFRALRAQHEAILFDAYGVLVDASGALSGAVAAVHALVRDGQPFLVVTNDASRSPARAAARLVSLGFPVTPAHVLSSGMLIAPALVLRGIVAGARVVVLGTRDSCDYAAESGATVVAPSVEHPADAVVIADESGGALLDRMDELLSMILAACRSGRPPRLLLANPDLVYPSGPERFGFTAGSLAHMLEQALQLLMGATAPVFEPLGKPAAPHFDEALRRIGGADAVMIGDQLVTDVAGARAAGIASALVLTGVTTRQMALAAGAEGPTYLLHSLMA